MMVQNSAEIAPSSDIASPTTDRLASWIDHDLIQPWTESQTNIQGISPSYQANHLTRINGQRMGIPSLWGSAGLGFNHDELALTYGSASLLDLFDDRYAGRMTLRADTALVAAGRALDAHERLPHPFDDS